MSDEHLLFQEKKQREPLGMFHKHIGPYSKRIMAKDESLIADVPNLLGGIDLHALYEYNQGWVHACNLS